MIPDRLVVGVAIVRESEVLLARRAASSDTPGGWEFPGGKVEAGETSEDAAVREIVEELGCRIEVTGWLPGIEPIRPGLNLVVCLAKLVDGEPESAEHEELRWHSAEELAALDWLPPDRPFAQHLLPG